MDREYTERFFGTESLFSRLKTILRLTAPIYDILYPSWYCGRPSGEKIAAIADKLDLKKNVVRVWFCNQVNSSFQTSSQMMQIIIENE
jgi:hypothetical protein